MGNSIQILDIIILAMIAGFIALRLRGVLGNKTGHEEQHKEENKKVREDQASHLKLVKDDEAEVEQQHFQQVYEPVSLEKLSKKAQGHLSTILSLESDFNIEQFVEGAGKAYPMILQSFWNGQMADVEGFLTEDVYTQFSGAVTAREHEGLTLENRLIETNEKNLEDIVVEDRLAKITVRFVSDIVSITRNEAGEVVAGDVSDAVEVVDIWTFKRELGSRDPNWLLSATRAG